MKHLVKPLQKVLKKHNEVVDIVLFGSITKNNVQARDIDIALLTEKEVKRNDLKKEIEKQLKKKVDLQIVTIKEYDKFLWIALIREGYSIKHDNYLHKVHRIKPVVLYKYSLKELTASKKAMFERAIKNFKTIEKLSNRVVLVPIDQSGEFSDFLKHWSIDFDSQQYGLLPLVRKED